MMKTIMLKRLKQPSAYAGERLVVFLALAARFYNPNQSSEESSTEKEIRLFDRPVGATTGASPLKPRTAQSDINDINDTIDIAKNAYPSPPITPFCSGL